MPAEAVVLLVALLALGAHEGSQYVLLRMAGASPKPAARMWGLKGVGWAFHSRGISRRALRVQWVVGPAIEGTVWIAGAVWMPAWRGLFVLLLFVDLLGNWLPGGDLRRAWNG